LSVLGIGTDLVTVAHIAGILDRHPERFLERCFRQVPPAPAAGQDRITRVAVRWAAKEAFLKALGADVRSIPYRDIEVEDAGQGPVKLVLHGRALSALDSAGGRRHHLAVSHEGAYVLATVILET